MGILQNAIHWLSGGSQPYHTLFHCMRGDTFWIALTVALDLMVAAGYVVIALHWRRNARLLPPIPARRALGRMRNIFLFCGACGYLFIPIEMFWPAWRLYDFTMLFLVFFTWRYAWSSQNLKVIYKDLGQSSKLSEELQKSQEESRRKSLFLNSLSHDLRTPLNGLMLQTQLAEMGLETNDRQMAREAMAEIKSSARATAAMLDSFLECARLDWMLDQGAPTQFDLGEFLAEVISGSRAAAAQKGLELSVISQHPVMIQADRTKLERIIANLVSNAVKFTEQGSIKVVVEPIGRALELHVIDTGIGIAPEHQPRLFDEFYQVANPRRDTGKGFGLGLSIARRLARQLGGDVAVQSAVGQGSQFTVSLPDIVVPQPTNGQPAKAMAGAYSS